MDSGENQFQLAFVEIAFQIVGLFLNLILSLFEGVMTDLFANIFSGISGGAS